MEDKTIYYVYEHRKKGTDEVFYIGIGKMHNGRYARAMSISRKNSYWTNIFKKYGFDWKIVFETEDREEACQMEIDLITKYGRRDLGTGTLVNMTTGGERSFQLSKESVRNGVEKRIENGTYDKCAEIARHRMLTNNPWKGKTHDGFTKKKVYQYDAHTGQFVREWKSQKSASIHYGTNDKTIAWALAGKRKDAIGFIWLYEYRGERIEIPKDRINGKPLYVFEYDDKENLVNQWRSIEKACKEIGTQKYTLRKYMDEGKKMNGRFFTTEKRPE